MKRLLAVGSDRFFLVYLFARAKEKEKEKPSQACEQPAQTNLILVIRTVT